MPQARCPHCGTLNQVAVGGSAVQVCCYACRTVFPAVFSDGATPPPDAATPHDAPPVGYPAGSYALKPATPDSGPVPPHLAGISAAGHAAPQAAGTIGGLPLESAPHSSDSSITSPEKSGGMLMALLVAATMFVALGSAVLVAALAVQGRLSVRDRSVEPPADDRAATHWSDAASKTLEIDDVRVRIDRAEWDVVRGRDRNGKIITSSEKYLSIIVNVCNRSRSDCLYESWHGGPYPAVLTDEDGRQLAPFQVPRFQSIEWHTPEETIERNLEVDDRLAFVVPPDLNHDSAEALLLELPAAAVGREGAFRFRLPTDMIEGY